MTGDSPIVVIGGGHAGFHTAAAIRERDADRRIVLVEAGGLPYQRPPLSKAFLRGDLPAEELRFRPASFYAEARIELVTGATVRQLDRVARRIVLADGAAIEYAHVVLATGSRHRDLAIPGHGLDGVVGLRSLADAADLRSRLHAAESIAVIGGGFIGLELASVAAQVGKRVTVFEASSRLMARSVTHITSRHFLERHAGAGVDVHLSTTVEAVEGDAGRVRAVVPSRGPIIPADLVVVGIGAVANDDLAAGAGLAVDDGVLVDEHLRTSDPCVSAVGDCARFPSAGIAGGNVRLESVPNAVGQARHVADRIVMGADQPYARVPWFWTEQVGTRLQIAGLSGGYDRVEVVGSADRFSVYAFSDGVLLSCESVNAARDHMRARRALAGDPAALSDLPGVLTANAA